MLMAMTESRGDDYYDAKSEMLLKGQRDFYLD